VTQLIVDASVALKWVVEEADSDLAESLLRKNFEFMAPEFMEVEIANVLWKKHRRGDLSVEEVTAAQAIGHQFPGILEPVAPIVDGALALALEHGRTVYDCLYVALALREGCQFVTADERLYDALRDALPGTIARLADIAGAEEDEAIT
jgi:predicted nucleic acid-binding protein